MTDIERRLYAAMHAAVDGTEPPDDLLAAVMRRHRRYVVRVAAAVLVAVAAVAAVPAGLASAGQGTPPSGPRSGSPTPSPSSPHRTQPAARHVRREPAWMTGPVMPPTVSLRLLVSGRDPVWFSSPSDASQPIAGLPRSPFAYSFDRVTGGWVAMFSPKGGACQPDCPGAMVPVYFVANGSAVARRIGTTELLAPGSGRGTAWLETYPRGTTDVNVAVATAQQVTSSGTRLGPPVRLPTGYGILRAVGSDLLLQPDDEGPGAVTFKLWDPRTRRVIRSFRNVLATSPSQVAWGICDSCAVHVLDLRTGVAEAVGVPRGTWAFDGQFSADGRFLAIRLSGGVTSSGYATLGRIAVIDLRAGRLRLLPGSSIGNDVPAGQIYGWQGGSDTLIAAVIGHAVTQVGIWRPGAAHLVVRRFWLPPGMTVMLGSDG